jgi:deazaflavin-dependent oxidoreductase (nitroreductase family)
MPGGSLRRDAGGMSRMSIAASRAHAWILERSGGRLLGRMASHPVLLLETTGRRTGLPRRTPLQFERIDGHVVVAAAANGAPTDPAWYRNLKAQPFARVRLGRDEGPAVARIADAEQRARLWPALCARNPALEKAQRRAGREIPVVVLQLGEWGPFGS